MKATPRFDLHVHSRYSPDGSETLEALAARAASLGLRGFALTDHNTIAGHREFAEISLRWPGLLLIPGAEVSTREGHLLLFGLREPPPPSGTPIYRVLDWAEQRQVVPVLAHPLRWWHGVGTMVAERARVPALETRNGHNSPRANRRAEAVRSARGLGSTGGSDAHRASDLGLCVTEFSRPIESVDEFLAELRDGRVSARGAGLDRLGRLRLAFQTARRWAARGFRSI